MNKSVTIKNIKNIQYLEFQIPQNPGVYVLTGGNGSGKTTLMTCLLRIGQSNAFADYFKTGNNQVDSYEGEIIYKVEDDTVSYHYAGLRWPPTPKKNSKLFTKFGYPEVRFLPATGNRLYIQDQKINPTDFKSVETNLKEDMNDILETDKFKNLKYVQTGSFRGPGGGSQRWKRAYVIKTGSANYYSEKNFSLGEILILNTLLLIQDVENGSMLLIDELEMALHPKVQIRLLKYLEDKAKEKQLTIILSTHSSSLIKGAQKLIYLEKQSNGEVKVIPNCYPAVILSEVAIEEDIQPDYIFIVEDDMAEMLLKKIIMFYFKIATSKLTPIYKVIPIGGYAQVLEFANNTKNYLFSSSIGQYLFLDEDVTEARKYLEKKGNSRDVSEQELYELFKKLELRINYLPITPELGLWKWLTDKTLVIQRLLNNYYGSTFDLKDMLIKTEDIFSENSGCDTGKERKKAKRRLKYIVKAIEEKTHNDAKRITEYMFSQFVKEYYEIEKNKSELQEIFGKIFSKRGNI